MSSTGPSTTATPTSTDASSPSPTNPNGSGSPSNTLYLLTFLATLFVLLFVSCGIVLRSFFIRRRFRRQIEEQVAAGILPPEALSMRHPRDFGEKPKLWDVHLVGSPQPYDAEDVWDSLEPVAARIIRTDSHDMADTSMRHTHPAVRYNPFMWMLSRRQRTQPPTEPPADPVASQSSSADTEPVLPPYDDGAAVQVAVFVQMPTPVSHTRLRSDDGEPPPIPEISVGVTQVPLRAEK